MTDHERVVKGLRWLRKAINSRAEDIRTLRNRSCAVEARRVTHDVVELLLQTIQGAVLSPASRAEVFEIVNTSIHFCASHFADEEAFVRNSGHVTVGADIAAHRQLLVKFVVARRSASGEGLSVAMLDVMDLLHDFDELAGTHNRTDPRRSRKTRKPRSLPMTQACHGA